MQSRLGFRQFVLFLLPIFLVISLLSPLFNFQTANAASLNLNVDDQTKSITYYNVLRVCIANNMYGDIHTKVSNNTDATPTAISWFDTSDLFVVYGASDGETCSKIMSQALKLWGFKTDGSDFLTRMGYKFKASIPMYTGSNDGTVRLPAFESLVQSVAFNTNFRGDAGLDGATRYYAFKTVLDLCGGKSIGPYSNLNSSQKIWVDAKHIDGNTAYTKIVFANPDGSTAQYGYTYNKDVTTAFVYGAGSHYIQWQEFVKNSGLLTSTCAEAVTNVSSSAQAAATALMAVTCKSIYATTSEVDACANGASNRSNIQYCASQYKTSGTYDGKIDRQACYAGQGNAGGEECITAGYTTVSLLNACISGARNKDPQYCETKFAGVYSAGTFTPQDKEKTACLFGQKLNVKSVSTGADVCKSNPGGPGCGPLESANSCAINAIGWIVCPVVNFLAGVADASYGFLSESFLKTDPKVLDTTAENGTFTAWSIMRTVANVVFAIVFLIIIFSQLTSMGISNYGVKKMLPRLIIAAILVNLSFFISQLAVDISNILGFSIKDLFDGMTAKVANTTAPNSLLSNSFNTTGGLSGIAGIVLATAIVGFGGYILITAFLPIVLAAVLALVMIMFILVARQAIIILLIVISPLAFVAFILPNTEKLFTQWRKILTSMLLLFPIIALVYGVSQLASQILTNANSYKDAAGIGGNVFGQIIASAILVLPLFAVPVLLKKSLEGIPALGQIASKFAGRANGNIGKQIKGSYKNSAVGIGRADRARSRDEFHRRKTATKISGGRLSAIAAGGFSNLGITSKQRAQRDAVRNNSLAVVAGTESEELKNARLVIDNELATIAPAGRDTHLSDIASDTSRTAAERNAALHTLAANGRSGVLRNMQSNPAIDQTSLRRAIDANVGSLSAKAPDLVKGSNAAFANVTGSEMVNFSADTMQTYLDHMESLRTDPLRAAEYTQATNGFNSAIEDIRNTPALQGTFKADSGRVIQSALIANPALASSLGKASHIRPDGKIRL